MNAPDSWCQRPVPVFWGIPDSHLKTGDDYTTMTLAQIFGMAPGRWPKMRGLAMLAGNYGGHDARCHAVQRERGSFVALAGDIDKGDHSLSSIAARVDAIAGDAAKLIYATPHSRPGNRRWRIMLPLGEPQGFDVWHDAQTVLFEHMETRGVAMDWALERPGQPIFLPNVPSAHTDSGTALRGANGQPLYYQRIESPDSAPGLRLDTGPIAAAVEALRQRRAAEERERERVRAEIERRRASQPDQGETTIEAFNRENSLGKLLAKYRYDQSPRDGRNWRSPLQTGKTFATQVIGGGKWFSLSGSDTDAGLGAKLSTGCIGDAFDLFAHFEYGGNRSYALSQLRREAAAARAIARMRSAAHG